MKRKEGTSNSRYVDTYKYSIQKYVKYSTFTMNKCHILITFIRRLHCGGKVIDHENLCMGDQTIQREWCMEHIRYWTKLAVTSQLNISVKMTRFVSYTKLNYRIKVPHALARHNPGDRPTHNVRTAPTPTTEEPSFIAQSSQVDQDPQSFTGQSGQNPAQVPGGQTYRKQEVK